MDEDAKENHWWFFVDWCNSEGVSLEDEEDYGPWWDCWKTGIASERKVNDTSTLQ